MFCANCNGNAAKVWLFAYTTAKEIILDKFWMNCGKLNAKGGNVGLVDQQQTLRTVNNAFIRNLHFGN